MREYRTLGLRLMVICLVAAMALAGVNALTAPTIEAQKKATANAARLELIAGADDFLEAVEMSRFAEKYPDVKNAYTAVDAAGNVVGYTVDLNSNGFGGAIEMGVGILADGSISGMRIYAHTESEGIGSKASEPEFYNEFAGITDVSAVQTISGATVTSNAVIKGVNIAQEFASECGSVLQDADAQIAAVDPYEDVLGGYLDEAGIRHIYVRGEGFGGEIIMLFNMNESGSYTGFEMVEHNETAGFGAKAADPDFASQFEGASSPFTINAISGATITSTEVQTAADLAAAFNAEKGAQLPSSFELPTDDGGDAEETTEVDENAVSATAKGFGGDVTVHVTFNADGTISGVTADLAKETTGIGSMAGEEDFLNQFIGLTNADGVDTISGATYSSAAVIEAVNSACANFNGN